MDLQLEISVEENELENWRERCNRRIEGLKAREVSNSTEDHQRCSENSTGVLILESQEAIQNNGNVDQFVDMLENIISSSSPSSSVHLSAIFNQVSPSGDSLLHDAVYFGREEIAELISHHFPQLLTKKNVHGDTPLHVAARSNDSSFLIQVILSEYESTCDEERSIITRITNEYGNTALHEAVYSNNLQGADILFVADKQVAHLLNNSNISPLYLAVQSSNRNKVDLWWDLVDLWLDAQDLFPENMTLPRIHGISPLHAAISTKNAELLKLMVEKESYGNLINLRDEQGGTAIHFAAKTGYAEGVRILLEKSILTAQEFDMKGYLPIHLASKQGHIEVVKQFCEGKKLSLRSLINKKGRNILHVAAKHGHEGVVQYLLRNTKHEQLDVNLKDRNGNTPLHLAAENLHYSTVMNLTLDKRIDLKVTNNDGLTARDLVLLTRETKRGVVQEITNMVLKLAGAKESDKAKDLLKRREPIMKPDDVTKNKTNTLMIMAILIVAVTFIAGFTVPGGVYSSEDPNPNKRGTAILAQKPMFKIFALFNMVAMYSSIFGSFFLLWAQIGNFFLSPSSSFISSAIFMVGLALLSMTFSFMAAFSLVVTHVSWISSLTIFIGISSFCGILILSNASRSILVVCIISRYRDEIFKVFLCVIGALSAVTLLAIVVSGPIMLLLYLLKVVH
ncbi:protein ACCELERATED CELL DEATH 6-like [Neltuma alba]|uniref:protein ACCELERATED CELL DEATH 6-like n=1 Tax=Neltuma alba TaxID=207710 RepID=UPI0010A48866|nr:protein ACCELERATED CELL DEATH 6-like [Prosopis alba]